MRNKTRVLLVTSFRGGSSFLGGMFMVNRDVFYMFEPLKLVEQANRDVLDFVQVKTLEMLFACNISGYLAYSKQILPSGDKLRREGMGRIFLQEIVRRGNTFTNHVFDAACRRKPHIVIKVIRAHKLSALVPLMKQGVRVVESVRDPRGTIASRFSLFGSNWPSERTVNDARIECDKLANNLRFLRATTSDAHLTQLLRQHFRLVRYDDVTDDLEEMVTRIYSFVGLRVTSEVEAFTCAKPRVNLWQMPKLPSNTTTCVSSEPRPPKWRKAFSSATIDGLQEVCSEVFQVMGFTKFDNATNADVINLKTDIDSHLPNVIRL